MIILNICGVDVLLMNMPCLLVFDRHPWAVVRVNGKMRAIKNPKVLNLKGGTIGLLNWGHQRKAVALIQTVRIKESS